MEGIFTYFDEPDGVTITRCQRNVSGHIIIPNRIEGKPVKRIMRGTFERCKAITCVTIPEFTAEFCNDDEAFSDCANLVAIIVDGANPNYSSLDGVMFDKEKQRLFRFPPGRTGAYTIPASVTSIESYAFHRCSRLISVTIPDSVTLIDAWAFKDCSMLADLALPPRLTGIGSDAFGRCASLKELNIPDSVMHLDSGFIDGCPGIRNIYIPENVSNICTNAFSGLAGLEQIVVSPTNSNYTSEDGVLFDKSRTTIIRYPARKRGGYTIPDSVTKIGVSAFEGCLVLTDVVIPDSVTLIEHSAFSGSIGLTSLRLPRRLAKIGNYAFLGCVGLELVTIPRCRTKIGDHVFDGCIGLPYEYRRLPL